MARATRTYEVRQVPADLLAEWRRRQEHEAEDETGELDPLELTQRRIELEAQRGGPFAEVSTANRHWRPFDYYPDELIGKWLYSDDYSERFLERMYVGALGDEGDGGQGTIRIRLVHKGVRSREHDRQFFQYLRELVRLMEPRRHVRRALQFTLRREPSTLNVKRLAKLERKARAQVIGQAQADAWYCRFMGKKRPLLENSTE